MESLARTGHFTVVAVTRPLEFEGRVKVEAADRLIAALEETAHLVVVIEQVMSEHNLKFARNLLVSRYKGRGRYKDQEKLLSSVISVLCSSHSTIQKIPTGFQVTIKVKMDGLETRGSCNLYRSPGGEGG